MKNKLKKATSSTTKATPAKNVNRKPVISNVEATCHLQALIVALKALQASSASGCSKAQAGLEAATDILSAPGMKSMRAVNSTLAAAGMLGLSSWKY